MHDVKVSQFSGPLSLLLQLAERGGLELSQISIAEITSQYLEKLFAIETKLQPAAVSDFALMGARLLYIKSLTLLPRWAPEQSQELSLLSQELDTYKLVRQYAGHLASMSFTTYPRPANHIRPKKLPALRVQSYDPQLLADSYEQFLSVQTPVVQIANIKQVVPLEVVILNLLKQLKSATSSFDTLTQHAAKQEVVVTFLAALELARTGTISAYQHEQFGSIQLEMARG